MDLVNSSTDLRLLDSCLPRLKIEHTDVGVAIKDSIQFLYRFHISLL